MKSDCLHAHIVVSVLAAVVSAALLDGAAFADTATTDELQEVVVTAQRRSEDLQRVPIAITAISNDTLTAQNLTNLQDLTNVVPGLDIGNNTGFGLLFIRGVGTTGLGIENDVGLYIDGVYVPTQVASLVNLTNIDHIEVLKGPQGTLFGRNSIGGAIQIVTKDPSQTPSADVSLSYANYDTWSGSFYGTTGVTDQLSTDLALYASDQSDGWGHDLYTGEPTFRSTDFQARNKWLYTPNDGTKVSFSLDYSNGRNQDGQNWHILPGALGLDGQTFQGFYNSNSGLEWEAYQRQYGATLRVDQDFSFARFVSISAYSRTVANTYGDQPTGPLPRIGGQPGVNDDTAYSQELQLLSAANSKLQWIVGGYYLHDRPEVPLIIVEGPTLVSLDVNEATESYAAFGQATYPILPSTNLTLGLRYTEDHKSITGTTAIDGVLLPEADASQSTTFSKTTYRVGLDHEFVPNVMGYVSYDTGFKSGQYNFSTYASPPVQPESLDAWQAGVKTELLDNRLRLNAAGFHYSFTNIQIEHVVTGGTALSNAASAAIYGADVDVEAQLSSNLKLQAAMEWLHGRYTNFTNAPAYVPTGVGGNMIETINATGNTTVRSPDATAYVAVDYTVPVGTGRVEMNVSGSYNSGFYWDPDNRIKQPSYALLNAFVKWSLTPHSTDVQLWGRNITNKEYYAFEDASQFGDVAAPAPPRTYGVTVTHHF
jgi:iron complex outermembrane recepter protein